METKTDVVALYGSAVEQARRIVDGVTPDQYAGPTPCPKWNTRELLNHFIGSSLMMASAGGGAAAESMSGTEAVAGMGDLVGDDPSAAYRAASERAKAAFSAPGALGEMWKLPFGEVPGAVALNIHLMETMTHGWDIAKSTGQLDRLDNDLAEQALPVVMMAFSEAPRSDAGEPFKPQVVVAGDAPAYERLAAFMGRNP